MPPGHGDIDRKRQAIAAMSRTDLEAYALDRWQVARQRLARIETLEDAIRRAVRRKREREQAATGVDFLGPHWKDRVDEGRARKAAAVIADDSDEYE